VPTVSYQVGLGLVAHQFPEAVKLGDVEGIRVTKTNAKQVEELVKTRKVNSHLAHMMNVSTATFYPRKLMPCQEREVRMAELLISSRRTSEDDLRSLIDRLSGAARRGGRDREGGR